MDEKQVALGHIIAKIQMKLHALRISADYYSVEYGPVVTTYYYKLGGDTPIAKILKAEEDIALAVEAPSCLITRKGGLISVAIPNAKRELVSFDEALHAAMLDKTNTLPIMVGVDTKGNQRILDLTEMPHLLIAGTTGSGKSVLLSSIISGLCCKLGRKELKLLLADTKQLDLTLFKPLPHVVEMGVDLETVHRMFDRLIAIVRQRTAKMSGIARNIKEYNSLQLGDPLPYYVCVIDELADILMLDRAFGKGQRNYVKAEHKLQQLLQISRAAGVHFIIATQRPSVEIITGDIKANLPTRIALRLPSGADSRTVISEYGAEQLLGKGDMLIESPLFEQITRFHGPFVSMDHIAKILVDSSFIRDMYLIEK